MALVGLHHEPVAKLGTVVILVPILMAYNKLVAVLPSPKQLVAVVCLTFGLVFLGIAASLAQMGTDLPAPASLESYGSPLGWLVYWSVWLEMGGVILFYFCNKKIVH